MQGEKHVEKKKGIVTYKGQAEIYCDYMEVTNPDGSKACYYFLNDKKLDNGCYIVSPILKEVIDLDIPKTSLGVINNQGDIVIPFENKSIKIVEDKYLLVVRNEARTKNVIDAVSSRNDPTAGTKMVNANASIKDKLNRVMSGQGEVKFILNDLLSEGTVYSFDKDGVHDMLDGQWFSFIGMTPNAFYCSTNVPDSQIVEVPKNAPVKSYNLIDAAPVVEPEPVPQQASLDVSNVSVSKQEIDSALESSIKPEEVPGVSKDKDNSLNKDNNFVTASKNVIPTISSTSVFNEPKNDIQPEEALSKPIVNIPTVELPEVQPDSIFSSKSDKVDKVDDTFSKDSLKFTQKNESKDESFGDVISAVTDLVQNNTKQQQELNKKDSTILSLQEKLRNVTDQTKKITTLQKENDQLHQENDQLSRENQQLQYRVNQLEEGYRQLRGALNASSSYGEVQSYKKVA